MCKTVTKKLISFLIAIIIMVTSCASITTIAESTNLQSSGTASANAVISGYPIERINDNVGISGNAGGISLDNHSATNYSNHIAYFQIDFQGEMQFNNVIIYTGASGNNLYNSCRPSEYAVDIKTSDGVWHRVAERHNVPVLGAWDDHIRNFKFETQKAVAVRVSGNNARNSASCFMISEMVVKNDSSITTADYTGITMPDAEAYAIPLATTNLQVLGKASTNSAVSGYPVERINDKEGIGSNAGSIGINQLAATFYTDNIGYFQIDFDTTVILNKVKIYTGASGNSLYKSCRPSDYAVDVKTVDGVWHRVAERHNVPVLGAWDDHIRTFIFESKIAVAVRVSGNNARNSASCFMLSEMVVNYDSSISSADYTGITAPDDAAYAIPLEGQQQEQPAKETARVILLSGQSNATGQTLVSYLEQTADSKALAEHKAGYSNVLIRYIVDANTNSSSDFVPVQLGQGATTEKFGPEVGIASYLSKTYPDEKFYIIKVSWSGSGIAAHWQEDSNEYKAIISRINASFKKLEDMNFKPELTALCWVQGETDALNETNANNYYNLQKDLFNRLFTKYQQYIPAKGVSVIDAGISDYWKYHETVNNHKKTYAAESNNRYYIDVQESGLTYRLENNDPSHYDSLSMIKLGELLGEKLELVFGDGVNHSLSADVSTSNSNAFLYSNYPSKALTDGKKKRTDSCTIIDYKSDGLAWIKLTFSGQRLVNKVDLYLSQYEPNQLPRDIAVDVLANDGWIRVAEKHNLEYGVNGDGTLSSADQKQSFTFKPQKAYAVRLTVSKNRNNSNNFRTVELECYNDTSVTKYTGIEKTDNPSYATSTKGDANFDIKVNANDLAIVKKLLLGVTSTGIADVNHDGENNVLDFITVQKVILKGSESPKKYFTLAFDDGITQDERIIEILKKYDAYCATFYINTGLYGKNSPEVSSVTTHLRYTEEELMSGIYDGFDVQSHSYNHNGLQSYDSDPDMLKYYMDLDVSNIEKITSVKPVGLAYPIGTYTAKTVENLLNYTDIRYARTIKETEKFNLPSNFMEWNPTCSIVDQNLLNRAEIFLNAECTEDMLFYVWGHGYNLDGTTDKAWEIFESLIKMMSESDDIVLVTNTEFYELFKDKIPSEAI